MDGIGDESIGVREYDFKKYGAEELIASSVGLGWSELFQRRFAPMAAE